MTLSERAVHQWTCIQLHDALCGCGVERFLDCALFIRIKVEHSEMEER